ncbi:MAG TPA: DUF3386 family protein [Chthonomonadaceae bacterium]|nr:DUF3386 family protein [Chthonomonadaceae bacterium]
MRITLYAVVAPLLCVCGSLLCAAPARAHFLWAQITRAPEPTLHLTFAEKPGEKTLDTLLPRIQEARVWTPDGAALTCNASAGALLSPLPQTARAAGAAQTWGVLDRAAQGRGVFLLQYYAKAALDAEAAAETANLRVEVFAQKEGADWIVTVRRDGKAEPGAELTITAPGETGPMERRTDAKGEARFQMPQAGLCAIRAMVAEKEAGAHEGKAYTLKRYYSTLTFPVTEESRSQADPAAYALLKQAHDCRETFGKDFPGLTAEVVYNDNGRTATGTLTYTVSAGVKLTLAGLPEESAQWAREQISSVLGHRRGGDFAKGDGRYPLAFAAEDHSPLGRKIVLNDALQSSYRVREKQVVEVTRTMGDERFTITVMETLPVEGGRYLPRHFSVTYFDAQTGAIRRVQQFTDAYQKVKNVWLPVSRRVVTAEKGTFTVRQIEFRNPRLLTTSAG